MRVMQRRSKRNNHQKSNRQIALERIEKLIAEARKTKDTKLQKRYVALAMKLQMKYKVRLPPSIKRSFCKKCHSFFIHGKNVRVRVHTDRTVYTCLECKSITRIGRTSKRKV